MATNHHNSVANKQKINTLVMQIDGFMRAPVPSFSEAADAILKQDSSTDGTAARMRSASNALSELSKWVSKPFDAPLGLFSSICALAARVISARVTCHELARRLTSLTPALVALSNKPPDAFTEQIVEHLNDVVDDCNNLLKQFAPKYTGPSWLRTNIQAFGDACSRIATEASFGPEAFEKRHNRLNMLIGDFQFATLVKQITGNDDMITAPAPSVDDIRQVIRDELHESMVHMQRGVQLGLIPADCSEEAALVMRHASQSVRTLNEQLPEMMRTTFQDVVTDLFDERNGIIAAARVRRTRKTPISGAGASHTIFEGIMQPNNVKVALKLLHDDGDDALVAEGEILRSVEHENVVACYGVWTCDDEEDEGIFEKKFLVLELLGASVQELIEKGSLQDDAFKLRVTFDIICGLDFLHSQRQQVVVGDLKPANVLVTLESPYRAKLIDFDAACIKSTIGIKNVVSPTTSLREAITVAYTAPELFLASGVKSPESDIFAFGMTLFQIWRTDIEPGSANAEPFGGLGATAIKQLICDSGRPAASVAEMSKQYGIPPIIARMIEVSWSQLPADRVLPSSLRRLKDIKNLLSLTTPDQWPAWLRVSSITGSDFETASNSSIGGAEIQHKPLLKMTTQQLVDLLAENGVAQPILDAITAEKHAGSSFVDEEFCDLAFSDKTLQEHGINKLQLRGLARVRHVLMDEEVAAKALGVPMQPASGTTAAAAASSSSNATTTSSPDTQAAAATTTTTTNAAPAETDKASEEEKMKATKSDEPTSIFFDDLAATTSATQGNASAPVFEASETQQEQQQQQQEQQKEEQQQLAETAPTVIITLKKYDPSMTVDEVKEVLVAFYEKHATEFAHSVDFLVSHYDGRLDELFDMVSEKYSATLI